MLTLMPTLCVNGPLHEERAMSNDRGESGERGESQSVTLLWCSHDQSKTTTSIYI